MSFVSSRTATHPFLRALTETGTAPIDGPILLVVAHPDDETIGVGGQMPRLRDLTIVHVTDGAPADMQDARRYGLETPAAYAALRVEELHRAVAEAGVDPEALICLGVRDQEVGDALVATTHRLAALMADRRAAVVLTHAYEGGHVDHDATAFCVHHAAALLGDAAPAIVEMPFYHRGFFGFTTQRFPRSEGKPDVALRLDREARARKQRMMAAHVTQAGVLARFRRPVESFRLAAMPDFRRPANRGRVHFPSISAQWTAERLLDRFAEADAILKAGVQATGVAAAA